MKKTKRVVVDTNVIISGLLSESGYPYNLISLLLDQEFQLVTSDEIHEELLKVATRNKFAAYFYTKQELVENLLFLITQHAVFVVPESDVNINIRDPNDQMFLGTAIAGNADYSCNWR